MQGLKERGISASYSLDSNSLTIDYSYPYCKELSELAYKIIGTYDTDSSLFASGKFFRLSSSIIGEDIMLYLDAYEEYDSYDTDIHISVKDILYNIIPHEGDGKHWSHPMKLPKSFKDRLERVFDKYDISELCFLHLFDEHGSPSVEYCENTGYEMSEDWSDNSSYIKRGMPVNMISDLLDVLLDEYKVPIKDVYFIGNHQIDFCIDYVIAHRHPDGELSLVFY